MSMTGILVWAERVEGTVSPFSYELLGMAHRLIGDLGGMVTAVVLGPDAAGQAEGLIARGADRVIAMDDPSLAEFHSDAALQALEKAMGEADPALFLFPHSSYGTELAPRLAFRSGGAPAMGCTEARVDDGKLLLTRPCYGGRARAITRARSGRAIATIRPKAQVALEADPARKGEVTTLDCQIPADSLRMRIVERVKYEEEGVRLDEAEIVVSGGMGLGGPEGFGLLEELAGVLGGAVGASRPVCDMGWYPQAHQVGLSGKTVAPELYIAVGISGAGQHMAGCGGSKVLVAINTDVDAAIFSHAHIGITADYKEVVPKILEVLRR